MTMAIAQLPSATALEPAQPTPNEELRWTSVGTVTMSVGDPGDEDEESIEFDENDFDDDFDDDFEDEIEDDEFESADPFQFDE